MSLLTEFIDFSSTENRVLNIKKKIQTPSFPIFIKAYLEIFLAEGSCFYTVLKRLLLISYFSYTYKRC